MIKFVIKRDGRVKQYEEERVLKALDRAYQDVYHEIISKEHSNAKEKILKDKANILSDYRESIQIVNEEKVSVEVIQDILVNIIKRYDPYLSKEYQRYREERTEARGSDTQLLTSIKGIIDNTNKSVITENANKKAVLQSTQRDLIAGEVSKAIAKQTIPKHIMDLHKKGVIHLHDLDYWMQGIINCDLVNLKDMLQNGTVISNKKINKPNSIGTAITIATQIAAQVASSQYGGQTMSLSHLAPFVKISEDKLIKKYYNRFPNVDKEILDNYVSEDLKLEIKAAVQTFNYQINTIMTTNGQSPFQSLSMYINEEPGLEKYTVMLIEEFLKQRIEGIENEFGIKTSQTFPKLLYFLDENNTYEGSEYYWLTELAVKSTSKRMNPDYISVKKMKENIGFAFPVMGCRAMLSPFENKNGEYEFYGRGNLGVQTINLPYLALESKGNYDMFMKKLDEIFEICVQSCQLRYDKLRGVKAESAPILWQHGALARLNPEDEILKAIDEKGFTVTVGYVGIYETVKTLTGLSHTTKEGFEVAKKIMMRLEELGNYHKELHPHLRISIYGTPQESTTEKFANALRNNFGYIEGITDKDYVVNSYHVNITEHIDAFSKLKIEGELQEYSKGGAVSYVETFNMEKNTDAVMQLVQFMYENIMYAEINFESDTCGICNFSGVMDNDPDTLDWICPQCGNREQSKLSCIRRTCGYLSENVWTKGRMDDILHRVKHL